MAQEWYYDEDGQQHGPISGGELIQMARSGRLKPTDKVKKDGMADWMPASQVKGLFPDLHDKVQKKARTVAKTAATVSKVARAAGKVSDAVSDVAEAGAKVQKAVATVAGIAAGGSTLAGSIGDFLRPLGPINLVIFAVALIGGAVLFVLAKQKPKVRAKVRLKLSAVASLAAAVIFGLWTGLGAVAGKDDKGFLATNVKPIERLQASVVPTRKPRQEPARVESPPSPSADNRLVAQNNFEPAPVEKPDKAEPAPGMPKGWIALADSLERFQKHWKEARGGRSFFDPVAKSIQIKSGGQYGGFTYAGPWQEFKVEFMVEVLTKNVHLFLTVNGVRIDISPKHWEYKVWKELTITFDQAASIVTLRVAGEIVERATVRGAEWGTRFSVSMDKGGGSTYTNVFYYRNPRILVANMPDPTRTPATREALPKGWAALSDTREQVQKHWRQGDTRGSFFYDAPSKTIKIKSIYHLGTFIYDGPWLEFQVVVEPTQLPTTADKRKGFNLQINRTTLELGPAVTEAKGPVRISVKYDPKEHTIVGLVDGRAADQATVTGQDWGNKLACEIHTVGAYGKAIISLRDARILTADHKTK